MMSVTLQNVPYVRINEQADDIRTPFASRFFYSCADEYEACSVFLFAFLPECRYQPYAFSANQLGAILRKQAMSQPLQSLAKTSPSSSRKAEDVATIFLFVPVSGQGNAMQAAQKAEDEVNDSEHYRIRSDHTARRLARGNVPAPAVLCDVLLCIFNARHGRRLSRSQKKRNISPGCCAGSLRRPVGFGVESLWRGGCD